MAVNHLPFVSIITPTLNRSTSLLRLLNALASQTYPVKLIEVLVVADGCSDDTEEVMHRYRAPYSLRFIKQTNQGAAAARNQGAIHAIGKILIFLDDDVEPDPVLVEVHVRSHKQRQNQVTIGHLPLAFEGKENYFRVKLRNWWDSRFNDMRKRSHCYSYYDLFSGNFSITAELFNKVGRFDPTFCCCEDYELGIRLLRDGATFSFVGNAKATHHDLTEVEYSIRRKYEEGKAGALLSYYYPEVRPFPFPACVAPMLSTFWNYTYRKFVYRDTWIGDAVAGSFYRALIVFEEWRLHLLWQLLLGLLYSYWYWRGLLETVASQQAPVRVHAVKLHSF